MTPAPLSCPRAARRGFTLIELMVVITIIAVLIGLLTPAVLSVMRQARIAAVRQDISGLEDALSKFKHLYGVPVPSQIFLCEKVSDWNVAARANDRALIRRMWPNFDFASTNVLYDVDFNGDGDKTDVIRLNGSECLTFFLGGVVSNRIGGSGNEVVYTVSGFSKNPLRPFEAGGNREGPFLEFDVNRFSDVNGNGLPEYRDTLPGQTKPYLYFSSYDGEGYRTQTNGTNPWQNTDNFNFALATPTANMDRAYYIALPKSVGAGGAIDPAGDTDPTGAVAFKPDTWQIISPGLDGEYGEGGTYNPKNPSDPKTGLPLYRPQTGGNSTGRYEADNITNFSTGVLAP